MKPPFKSFDVWEHVIFFVRWRNKREVVFAAQQYVWWMRKLFCCHLFLKEIYFYFVIEVLNWSQEWKGLLFNYSDVPTNVSYIVTKNLNAETAAILF